MATRVVTETADGVGAPGSTASRAAWRAAADHLDRTARTTASPITGRHGPSLHVQRASGGY